MSIEYFLFLPQMRLSAEALVDRARAAEAAGFVGIVGMDHLVPPVAAGQPMYDALMTATWQAAHTSTLKVGSLVLCDPFRHPAVLAKECVALDHFSGGRFELGIGWGSVQEELDQFGISPSEPRDRVARLQETLEVLRALWSGEVVDYDGRFHQLRGAQQLPTPLERIPLVIGGAGKKTMRLVATYADWWNIHAGILDRFDEARPHAGDARVSMQQMVAYVRDESERVAVTEMAGKRFSYNRPVVGTASELVDHFGGLEARGVERVYVWFTDFAATETLAAFGEGVIRA